jgi:hypothetical protein
MLAHWEPLLSFLVVAGGGLARGVTAARLLSAPSLLRRTAADGADAAGLGGFSAAEGNGKERLSVLSSMARFPACRTYFAAIKVQVMSVALEDSSTIN